MASKKLPKKIKVSILHEESQQPKKSSRVKKGGHLVSAAQDIRNEALVDEKDRNRKLKRYNYKKGSPKNKHFMNHEVPQGEEKKVVWLWISVGVTLFVVFCLWIGTLMYLDFFKIDREGLENTDLKTITDDIKSSYSDFSDSLGTIGEQIEQIKEEAQGTEQEELPESDNKEEASNLGEDSTTTENDNTEQESTTDNVLNLPGLELQEN